MSLRPSLIVLIFDSIKLYRSLKKLILVTIVFCAGITAIVDSQVIVIVHIFDETLKFSLGLAICIVSGVVLFKEIRDYIRNN